jgi:transketolase
MTHHGIEDVPIMTAIPNMTVISPCDPIEAMLAAKAVVDWDGPCYIRIRRNGEKNIHNEIPAFSIGKGIIIKDGSDITLIGSGWILKNILDATELLEKAGISVRIISMHTVQPIDCDLILQSAQQTGSIISIEDQNTYGLGARVAMTLASSPYNTTQFKALGLTKDYYDGVGSEDYHLQKTHLTADCIFKETQKLLQMKKR